MGNITDMNDEVLLDESRAEVSGKWREDCKPTNETVKIWGE